MLPFVSVTNGKCRHRVGSPEMLPIRVRCGACWNPGKTSGFWLHMAGCPRRIEVTPVLLAAVAETAGQTRIPIHERGNMMAAKKTTTKKTNSQKKAPAKKASTKKPTAKKAPTKAKKKPKGKLSGLDAAAKVLAEASEPLRCKQIVETMLAKGYWTTNGKTPAATIYAAILREIQTKGKEARFRKTDRGLFTVNR